MSQSALPSLINYSNLKEFGGEKDIRRKFVIHSLKILLDFILFIFISFLDFRNCTLCSQNIQFKFCKRK